MYSDSFILTHYTTVIYKYNLNIKLIPFEICLIHKPTHLTFKM